MRELNEDSFYKTLSEKYDELMLDYVLLSCDDNSSWKISGNTRVRIKVAECAVKNGCIILRKENGKFIRGNDIEMITQDNNRYYFYLPEAGDLEFQMQNDIEFVGGYNSSGNVVIEASYSIIKQEQKTISRGRLFSVTEILIGRKIWALALSMLLDLIVCCTSGSEKACKYSEMRYRA